MKKTTLLLALAALLSYSIHGQEQKQAVEYKTFIYTSTTLSDEIQKVNDEQSGDVTRRFGADMLAATLNAGKSIASGYVTSFIDMGVNAIASLITRNSRLKSEWETTVQAENTWSTQLNTVEEIKDFYKRPSESGALDPMGMNFDGIGCIRMEGNDTVFFVSCHIDRSKLNRIINHSKFELVLDTLIISPTRSNLPNSALPLEFSFEERKGFNLSINIKLTSSWFTDVIELHNNEQLGEFNINVPVEQNMLDEKGFFRYARKNGATPQYKITGESFIVPRSYMGFRDKDDVFHNIWGTGQYKVAVELKETCGITDSYRNDWKNDRKRRKKMQSKQGFFSNVWQTVSQQKWDEITQSWVITTLSAPAGVLSKEVINELGLDTQNADAQKTNMQSAGAQNAGTQTPNMPKKP